MGIIHLPSTTITIVIILLGIYNYKKNLFFNKYIIYLVFFLILNYISCSYYNNQDILSSFRAGTDFYSLFLFWFFYRWKLNLRQWEKTLWWICFCFGICYIIQYIMFPTIIFGGQIRIDSEEQRIAIYGQGLASLSVIFGLNKYLIDRRKKYIIIILLGLFAVFGCGYRTMLLSLSLSIIILVLRLRISKRTLLSLSLLVIMLAVFIINVDFIQYQIENMSDRQENLNEGGLENDFRYINLLYHYTSFFKSPIELFLGSGLAFEGTDYYKYIKMLDESGMYYSDLGLIGLSWMIGIPAVLIMIIYSYQIYKKKVNKEYIYIGIYFFNIVISSITTHEFYIHLNFVVQAILFCIFTKILEKEERQLKGNKLYCIVNNNN